ncbi:MAG: translation elongation factor 4 [Phycisphaeraceae bacterium]|nr:translation elongation factor 4 [Phycisphaeraceae bacterium]
MQIRNFSIIAHIDHGKSTLADRLMQATKAVSAREARAQLLDDMDIERERGITIKASAVTVMHHHTPGAAADDLEENDPAAPEGEAALTGGDNAHGQLFMLNFIDTPGHVDFNYEVSRALKACEGALLVVDATQGVQAQTVVNAYLAINENLTLIPVINKIDLPSARADEVAMEIEQVLGLPAEDCIHVSAKTGIGIPQLLAAICERLPAPAAPRFTQTRGLIFDAQYDDYRGVIVYARMFDGSLKVGDKIRMMGTGRSFQITDIGKRTPKPVRVPSIGPGEAGYIVAAIRSLADVRVGDTITLDNDPAPEALPGYKPPTQVVFCDFYPATTADAKGSDFEKLRDAIEKLSLNDSSFTYIPVHSEALGFGFRCGFLGLLHMEITQERLEREFQTEVVQTAPTVTYQVVMHDGSRLEVHNPAELPKPGTFDEIREPICKVEIILPNENIGDVLKLCSERRGVFKSQSVVGENRQMLTWEIPLAELIYDFYDKLKAMTSGYGTMDYEITDFRPNDLVKVDILINGEKVEALALICHRQNADFRGRILLKKLQKQIDRHQFEIPLQAAIGGKIIARETIKAFRKDVTAKCYGGDVSRKRKLLEKQKEGKKKMKSVGRVDIPQEAFMAVLDQGE